ncbi:MAG: response regulator [Betaproteobacteria bacterium]|nr:response regulator [Betaproteobacteria bacterium]
MGFPVALSRRVAIADDSPAFLAAAANYIASLPGFELAGTANNALDALVLVESATPDLLLLDLGLMPSRGLELVRRLKSSPRPPAIIALALFHAEETRAQARAAGADALIGKEAFVTGLAEVLPQLFPGG